MVSFRRVEHACRLDRFEFLGNYGPEVLLLYFMPARPGGTNCRWYEHPYSVGAFVAPVVRSEHSPPEQVTRRGGMGTSNQHDNAGFQRFEVDWVVWTKIDVHY